MFCDLLWTLNCMCRQQLLSSHVACFLSLVNLWTCLVETLQSSSCVECLLSGCLKHLPHAITSLVTIITFLSLLPVIPHPPWPLLISDVGLELEGTLINCSLL